MSGGAAETNDDGGIACDAAGIVVRRYYPWGDKSIPYASVRGIDVLPVGRREHVAKAAALGNQ